MIRGIIFDCFGVLCQGSLDYMVAQASPETRQEVVDVNHAADQGYLTRQEYIDAVAPLLAISPDAVEAIIKTRHVRVEPAFTLARSLKADYKLGMLSNVGDGIIDQLFTSDELASLFDTVVLSGEVGMVKPYPEIYELTARRLGLQPEECVMIDDLPRNIEGATLVGMKGVVFGDSVQCRRELEALGIV